MTEDAFYLLIERIVNAEFKDEIAAFSIGGREIVTEILAKGKFGSEDAIGGEFHWLRGASVQGATAALNFIKTAVGTYKGLKELFALNKGPTPKVEHLLPLWEACLRDAGIS